MHGMPSKAFLDTCNVWLSRLLYQWNQNTSRMAESRKSLSSFDNALEKMSRTLFLRQPLPLLLLARILRWLSSCVTVAYMLAHFKFFLPLPPPSFPNVHHSCNLLTATTQSTSRKPNPSSARSFQSWILVIQLDTKIVQRVALFIDSILFWLFLWVYVH